MFTLSFDVMSHTGENGIFALQNMMRNSSYSYGQSVLSLELLKTAPTGYDEVKVVVNDRDTMIRLIADYCDDLPENITQDDIDTYLV